ncbi:MAG TPA: acetolactate synthase [Clostridia bacterium]|nr:acetolactate synthase [Clostridia bacterium]
MVKQISVFIENKKGRLANLTKELGENNIDLKALSIADTTDFGILRFITNDAEKTIKVITEKGYTAKLTDVIAVQVEDKPGGLAYVLDLLNQQDISIEYLYSFVRTKGTSALIIFRVNDSDRAVETLKKNGVKLLTQEEINAL